MNIKSYYSGIPVSSGGGGNDLKTFPFSISIMVKGMISPQKSIIILNEIR